MPRDAFSGSSSRPNVGRRLVLVSVSPSADAHQEILSASLH